nr:MAG TPA: hypothetical protein [Caudoviricetes sp.]
MRFVLSDRQSNSAQHGRGRVYNSSVCLSR